MALVAISMVAIIAIAALSIDVITLYLAREESQRTADAAAIAAAQVLSLSGVTGDPGNVQGSLPSNPWPLACAAATQMAQSVANQNSVGRSTPNTVTVTFLYNGAAADCNSPSAGFVINPQVQVQIVRQGLPTFFSRIWRTSSNRVSASATAEAYNPSNSASVSATSLMVPVNPRCVKPWIIPNADPDNGGARFVDPATGSINNPGIDLNGVGGVVIGESFTLQAACGGATDCTGLENTTPGAGFYVPALVAPPATAVPSCGNGDDYQSAIAGCDQGTVYACGATAATTQVDLTINPGGISGDTSTATQCLIRQVGGGEDLLDPGVFPYRINAGSRNPVVNSGAVSNSSSIVTIPIYDGTKLPNTLSQPPVVIVGFLQAFINSVDGFGNPNITVLNVAGCGNTVADFTTAVTGTSPVPVRLITSP